MGKKCIPGVICVENMTLFVMIVILIVIVYFYYTHVLKDGGNSRPRQTQPNLVIISPPISSSINTMAPLANMSSRTDTLNDPYAPPLKSDALFNSSANVVYQADVRGVPVNVKTRGINTNYEQIGILTRSGGRSGDMILPLMGRRTMAGRDKWQYYTISNTGNMNTKLPVSMNGKSCTSEYGCDNINNGDVIYVEGYKDTFAATVYETGTFSYIPYL
jgi:hypothetical protein